MNLENYVNTLEQAKKLKELGIERESIFCWYGSFNERPRVFWEMCGDLRQPVGFEDDEIEKAHELQEWELCLRQYIPDLESRSWKGMYKNTLTEYNAYTSQELDEIILERFGEFEVAINANTFIFKNKDYSFILTNKGCKEGAQSRAEFLIYLAGRKSD